MAIRTIRLPEWKALFGTPLAFVVPEACTSSCTKVPMRGASSSSSIMTATKSSSTKHAPSLDRKEMRKFEELAREWWNPGGPFWPLHALNRARVGFLRTAIASHFQRRDEVADNQPLAALKVLDVGCGGGLLSEALARLGAVVMGIDLSEANVLAARQHAALDASRLSALRYECVSAEELVADRHLYDVVVSSEVIEHVRAPAAFCATLASLCQHNGCVAVTTINRTPASYIATIAIAEYVLGLLPPGTHTWSRFIRPEELQMAMKEAGLNMSVLAGMQMNPLNGLWSCSSDVSVNYAALFKRR